ncbi:MAG: hypothetical protein H6550_11725 [Chitinophagales bacterium]|nr:hypothetical protein [Chitinophagales bacterium]
MKKALLIASALVITFGMTSCKKKWTCECEDPADNFEIEAVKSVAKTTCEGTTPVTGNVTGCHLK